MNTYVHQFPLCYFYIEITLLVITLLQSVLTSHNDKRLVNINGYLFC